jgi:hypothetical protein
MGNSYPKPAQATDQPADHPAPDSMAATENSSYRRTKPFVLTDEVRRAIAGAIAEIDREQIRILRTKTLAQRVQQAASLIEAAEQVSAYRLRQREPELSEEEALRIVRGGLLNYMRRKRRP